MNFLLRNATNRIDKLVKDLESEVMSLFLYNMGMQSLFTLTLLSNHQMNSRQRVEASLRQLERERALLQHQSAESLRKVELEAERKRSLENEREQPESKIASLKVLFNTLNFICEA